MNLWDLTGKTAVVTGGRNGLLGPIWCETIRENGGMALVLDLPECDISDDEQVRYHINELIADYGVPNIVVNNAAIDNPPTTNATFFGNFMKIMGVNIGGAVNMCEALIPHMVKNGGGIIVNIGSIQGYGGADHRNYEGDFEKPVGYNLSKWALRGYSKSLTVQYGRYGIRAVTPSFGPYNGGKLKQSFLDKFLHNVPMGCTVSKEDLQRTLLYAICCNGLAGEDWRVDGGLGAWA